MRNRSKTDQPDVYYNAEISKRRPPDTGPLMVGEPDPDLSDDALLVLYANGDGCAVQELTMRLSPRCFGVAMRVLGNRAEAEDITQEAMMRLWRMAPNWQPGQAQLSTWLYRVAMNLCIDLKRRCAEFRI